MEKPVPVLACPRGLEGREETQYVSSNKVEKDSVYICVSRVCLPAPSLLSPPEESAASRYLASPGLNVFGHQVPLDPWTVVFM